MPGSTCSTVLSDYSVGCGWDRSHEPASHARGAVVIRTTEWRTRPRPSDELVLGVAGLRLLPSDVCGRPKRTCRPAGMYAPCEGARRAGVSVRIRGLGWRGSRGKGCMHVLRSERNAASTTAEMAPAARTARSVTEPSNGKTATDTTAIPYLSGFSRCRAEL